MLFLLALTVRSTAQAQIPAPPAPLLVAPPGGALTTGTSHPPLGIPLLAWDAVPQAVVYHVQVAAAQPDGTCSFAAPVAESDTTATSFSVSHSAKPSPGGPPLGLHDGAWCWRVQAATGSVFRPVWGPYSEAAVFRKDWSNGGALRPTLLLPQPGAEPPRRAAFLPGDFSWSAVPGAATYRLEIATSGDFAPASIVYAAAALGTTHTPDVRLPNGLYAWRVTPLDGGGGAGAASETGRFVLEWNAPPQLLTPEDGIVTRFTPRFAWTAVEGAREYVLEISTSPNFTPAETQTRRTRNTDYTPTEALDNSRRYYWRVRAVTTAKVLGQEGTQEVFSPDSARRSFDVQWDMPPRLLTPAASATGMGYPFFAWEPVPGAERYQVQVDATEQFIPPFIADARSYNAPAWTESGLQAAAEPLWWRVSALDAQGNSTPASQARIYQPSTSVGPNLVYPLPYYEPDAANLPVHGDRTLAWPVFVWDTAHATDANGIRTPPEFYRLTVDEQDDFATPNVLIETAGLAAAPTLTDTLIPLENGHQYFWRVQAISGGAQLGGQMTWRFRYDAATPELPFAATATPIQPQDGFEAVGDPPVLGWLPVTGAARYRVQVAGKSTFATVVDEALTAFVNYAPWQGRKERMPSGEYWWRVRAEDGGGAPLGEWSAPRRFMVAVDLLMGNPFDFDPPGNPLGGTMQSTTLLGLPIPDARPDYGDKPGYTPALTFIAGSPIAGAGSADLGALHVMVDRTYLQSLNWVIAFGAAGSIPAGQTVYYGLYVDVDHRRDSGGPNPVTGAALPGGPLYRPEYFVQVARTGNSAHADNVTLHSWNAAEARWNAPQTLTDVTGVAWFDPNSSAVQLLVPFAALGAERADFSGTLALTLFSSTAPGGESLDVVPPQGFDKPALISDMLTPLYPFDTSGPDARVVYDMPTLRWRAPYFDSVDRYEVEVARDATFTEIVDAWEAHEADKLSFFELLPAGFQTAQAMADGDYYWRVHVCHERYIAAREDLFDCGAWSPPLRFTLGSRRPDGLSPGDDATTLATPAFTWQRVEGAASYVLQVGSAQDLDDAANVLYTRVTEATSFTPTDLQDALEPGKEYFWRVAMRRSGNVAGRWTETMRFTKGYATPAPLAPLTGTVSVGQPTFVWTAVLTPTVAPRLAAPRYKVQVDDDRDFDSPAFSVETQATSYTPPAGRGLKDGTWHWRVMLLDAGRHAGPESLAQTFTKVSPPPRIAGPDPGASNFEPPVLRWDAVEGAAYYEVKYADNADFRNAHTVYSAGTSYTPTRKLEPGIHLWRVRAFDADGLAGPQAEGSFIFGQLVYLPAVMR